jgi:signal transduction histidine kinase
VIYDWGKDEFPAMISHQLRLPLNAILDYTRMLRSGPADRAAINISTEINLWGMAQAIERRGNPRRIRFGRNEQAPPRHPSTRNASQPAVA